MSLYNNPSPLEINDAVGENLRKFRQEVDIYFIATEAYEKPVKVQVARLLNLLGPEALKVYNTFNREANVCRTNHQNQFGRNGKPVNEIVYDLDTVYDSLSIEWGGHERAKVWKTPKNTYVESEGKEYNTLLKQIFAVALYETEACLEDGNLTASEIAKQYLLEKISMQNYPTTLTENMTNDTTKDTLEIDPGSETHMSECSSFKVFVENIKLDVLHEMTDSGQEDNGKYLPNQPFLRFK
ncbi:hypothetical protein M8J77_019078 [Diaphorina citri]|nr:hypothetical protein M8J77_019078 [Diaphorina citri]